MAKKVEAHWQWQKGFFGAIVLRYLVTWFAIVPIIAKMFDSLHFHISSGKEINFDFQSNVQLPFSLEMLWLSSLFFVVALLIYQIACPSFIKKYSSFGDYKKHLHSPRWIIHESLDILNNANQLPKLFERMSTKEYLKPIEESIDENRVEVEKHQTVAYFKYKSKSYSIGLPVLKSDMSVDQAGTELAELELFWEIFGRFSSSRSPWRQTIVILLIISGALFLYTLFEHIYIYAKMIHF
jgi:hypothetical protein